MAGTTAIRSESFRGHTKRLKAQAINLDGATVNQSIMDMIGDYQRKNGVMWQLIPNKKYAKSPTVQEGIKDKHPVVGAVDRSTLDHQEAGVTNPPGSLERDLADPGQDIKAISGEVEIPHFAHSMNAQQGYAYEDTFAENTDDLLHSATRYVDRQLIVGDSAQNPNEFNGLLNLMTGDPGHTAVLDLTDSNNTTLIHQALNKLCIRALNEPNNINSISHIFCSGGGQNALITEAYNSHIYQNQKEIAPGHIVNAIVTPGAPEGTTPIVSSPYIFDEAADDNSGDFLDFWLVDMSLIEWHTVVPFGGRKTHELQIFDFTKYVSGNPLVEKRMILQYGTLYAKNRGRGIYRLRVKAAPGSGIIYA